MAMFVSEEKHNNKWHLFRCGWISIYMGISNACTSVTVPKWSKPMECMYFIYGTIRNWWEICHVFLIFAHLTSREVKLTNACRHWTVIGCPNET
jgi:hypothetical protein